MHRGGFIKSIGLTAVAVVVIGVIWYEAVQPAEGWPAEDRRVVHPAGFSIVQPQGWERHVAFATGPKTADALRFLPIKVVGSPGFFQVTRVANPVSEKEMLGRGYTATTFAGRPAFERLGEFEFTHEHSRNLVFERDGQWFEITVRRPSVQPLDSGLWGAYVASFRTEPVRQRPTFSEGITPPITTVPASQPTSAPATTASP